jgi:hypothetical protein
MRPCDLSNILGQLDADDLNRLDRKTREVVRGVEETGLQGTGHFGLPIAIWRASAGPSAMECSCDRPHHALPIMRRRRVFEARI